MNSSVIRIATRTSALALWQARDVARRLQQLDPGLTVDLVPVVTSGDQNQTKALRQLGGTGIFTREVQRAVLEHRADLAVHSLKDLPVQTSDGLMLAGVPERELRTDALLLRQGASKLQSLAGLPKGARVGSGSPRRQAQLRHLRPDLQLHEIRGNLETRIRKLDEGQFDAIVLAEAGLRRLGLENRISLQLTPPDLYPAVGQGALGIECRTEDEAAIERLQALTCPTTLAEVIAERSLLGSLRAGCHAPLGAWVEVHEGALSLTGVLLSVDGRLREVATAAGTVEQAAAIGQQVAYELKRLAPAALDAVHSV
jgi:hydroxymethylbilane synthase